MPKTYTTVSGDMWDAIAYKAMGSELYKSALMTANPEHRYNYIFSADVVLTIPEKDEKAIEGLPPWKKAGVVYG
jgi:phage tail protein X